MRATLPDEASLLPLTLSSAKKMRWWAAPGTSLLFELSLPEPTLTPSRYTVQRPVASLVTPT